MKVFNTQGTCIPEENYMVDISENVSRIRAMVDAGLYFTINRARQYGKTTTLTALARDMRDDYCVLSLDFQYITDANFRTEESFVKSFCRLLKKKGIKAGMSPSVLHEVEEIIGRDRGMAALDELFDILTDWCDASERPIVLIIDEVDSAANNQVFLDFLAMLRLQYLERRSDSEYKTFKSVILAGVTDVKNLKRKLRPEDGHKFNSPWNIAAPFTLNMGFTVSGIAGMLAEYEADHDTGMDTLEVAEEIYNWTGGYPFLVSRICQIADTELTADSLCDPESVWSAEGISDAVRKLLLGKETLFDSLMEKVYDNAPLREVLQRILFGGERIPYNPDNIPAMDAEMYGFISNKGGALEIANRIFETRLYNYFLSLEEMKENPISDICSDEHERFVDGGKLHLDRVLEKYAAAFDDIYGDETEIFDEDEGRRRFLLFIRPIINGTGNYYIEAETRNNRRMDLVIDYLGERQVVELKIWRGKVYHEKGERQLADYLKSLRLDRGYLLTYCFNKNKKTGMTTAIVDGKELVEVIV